MITIRASNFFPPAAGWKYNTLSRNIYTLQSILNLFLFLLFFKAITKKHNNVKEIRRNLELSCTKYVEAYAAIDKDMYDILSRDKDEVETYLQHIFGLLDTMYDNTDWQDCNIRVMNKTLGRGFLTRGGPRMAVASARIRADN